MIEKILIIGGNGFLGKYLLSNAIKNPLPGYSFYQGVFSNKATHTDSVYINILDPLSVESAAQNFDIIINCSGQITTPISLCYQQNTIGIQMLAKAIKKYNRYLIHLSSSVVYGTADNPDELSPLNFETPYAACKCFAEYIINNEIDEKNFLILRIANLYGGDPQKGLFAYLRRSFSSNRVLEFNNDGNQKKSFIHIDDCITSLKYLLGKRAHGFYNLPNSDSITIREIIKKVETYTGIIFDSYYNKDRHLEILNGLNANKFFSQTGYIPQHTIDSFLKSSFIL
jgi:nucleoside-diphosphate-sugar epimerase